MQGCRRPSSTSLHPYVPTSLANGTSLAFSPPAAWPWGACGSGPPPGGDGIESCQGGQERTRAMENVASASIGDMLTESIDTITPDETVTVAKRRMESQTSRSLIVVDGN